MTSFRQRLSIVLSSLVLVSGFAIAGAAHAADKAVFSVSDNDEAKWGLVLMNARNLQRGTESTGGADIEVVAFGPGILALKTGSPLEARLQEAAGQGIKVVACKNTMAAMKLNDSDMQKEIGYVPSGVVEVMRKQQQGYAYIRP